MPDKKRVQKRVHRPKWTATDCKLLARLKKKYSSISVAKMLALVDAKPRGRPANQYKYYEDMHLAGVIQEWIEEMREHGDRKAVTHAILKAYELQYGSEDKKPLFTSYQDMVKKKRSIGRRDSKEQLEAYEAGMQRLKSRGDNK